MIVYRKYQRAGKSSAANSYVWTIPKDPEIEKLSPEQQQAILYQQMHKTLQQEELEKQKKHAEQVAENRRGNIVASMADAARDVVHKAPLGLDMLAYTAASPILIADNLGSMIMPQYETPDKNYLTDLGFSGLAASGLGEMGGLAGTAKFLPRVMDEATLGIRHLPTLVKGVGKAAPRLTRKPIAITSGDMKMDDLEKMLFQMGNDAKREASTKSILKDKTFMNRVMYDMSPQEAKASAIYDMLQDVHIPNEEVYKNVADYVEKSLDPRNFSRLVKQFGSTEKAIQRNNILKTAFNSKGKPINKKFVNVVSNKGPEIQDIYKAAVPNGKDINGVYFPRQGAQPPTIAVRNPGSAAHETGHFADLETGLSQEYIDKVNSLFDTPEEALKRLGNKAVEEAEKTGKPLAEIEAEYLEKNAYQRAPREFSSHMGTDLRNFLVKEGYLKDEYQRIPYEMIYGDIVKKPPAEDARKYYNRMISYRNMVKPGMEQEFVNTINNWTGYSIAALLGLKPLLNTEKR